MIRSLNPGAIDSITSLRRRSISSRIGPSRLRATLAAQRVRDRLLAAHNSEPVRGDRVRVAGAVVEDLDHVPERAPGVVVDHRPHVVLRACQSYARYISAPCGPSGSNCADPGISPSTSQEVTVEPRSSIFQCFIFGQPGVDRGHHLLTDQLQGLAGAGVGDDCLAGLEPRARKTAPSSRMTAPARPSRLQCSAPGSSPDRAAVVEEAPGQRVDQRLVAADADRRGVEQAERDRERPCPRDSGAPCRCSATGQISVCRALSERNVRSISSYAVIVDISSTSRPITYRTTSGSAQTCRCPGAG